MSTSSAPIWLCGHCGRPVADNPTKWIEAVPFHVECTQSPYFFGGIAPVNPETHRLIREAVEKFAALSPEEQEAHLKQQRENYARSEMAWGDEGTRVVSDAAAYALLERIAHKAAEPFNESIKDKTVGQWRGEIRELLQEAVNFVAARSPPAPTERDGVHPAYTYRS